VATLYKIWMTRSINKKNIGSEQASQNTSESLPANLPPSQTAQQNWNLQIQATPQPQEMRDIYLALNRMLYA